MIVKQVLLPIIIPQLLTERIIRDRSNQIVCVIKGIPLEKLFKVCKSLRTTSKMLNLLQKQLLSIGFVLRGYIHESTPYLTAIPRQKIDTYLDDTQAFILGLFIALREQKNKNVSWLDLKKELTEGMIKIKNPRKHLEFLVGRGLLYQSSSNPLLFDYGPSFYLEFEHDEIDEFSSEFRQNFLLQG